MSRPTLTALDLEQRLSTRQYAKLRGIAEQTARKERLLGSGPPYQRTSGPRGPAWYRLGDVLDWLERHTYSSTSQESAQEETRKVSSS